MASTSPVTVAVTAFASPPPPPNPPRPRLAATAVPLPEMASAPDTFMPPLPPPPPMDCAMTPCEFAPVVRVAPVRVSPTMSASPPAPPNPPTPTRHRAAGFLGQGERGRHVGAAVAAATADALRQHADGTRAHGAHIAVHGRIDIEAVAGHAAATADAHRQRRRAAIGEAERAGNIHRAVAAAAAHALQQHAEGIVTRGEHGRR